MEFGTGDDRDPRPPLLSILFGYGPALPLPIAALVAWIAPAPAPFIAVSLAVWWGAAILLFLAGVRRGLSFRTEGGPRLSQMLTMMWLFVLGAGALAVPTALSALALLVLGYASILVLDPIAARRGEAPAHFARLRPPQMGLALLGLVALMVETVARVMPV
jgi:hypothetical protein